MDRIENDHTWALDQIVKGKLIVRGVVPDDDLLAASLELYFLSVDGTSRRMGCLVYRYDGQGRPTFKPQATASWGESGPTGLAYTYRDRDWQIKEHVVVTKASGEKLPLADPRLLHHFSRIMQFLEAFRDVDTPGWGDVRVVFCDLLLAKLDGLIRRQFREWERIFSLK